MADTFKLVSGGEDIKIWESPNLRLLQTFKPHSQAVSSLSWSPNNNFLASTTPGDNVVVTSFKGSSPNSVELPGCEDDICLAFNSTSRHLLTAGKSKILNLWDLKTRAIKKKIKNPTDAINCVTFNWNDTNIASGNTAGDIFIHSVTTTQTSPALRLPKTQTIHRIHYSKFKKAFLGSVSDDGAMNIWDTNSKKVVSSFPDQHTAPAIDICFSPMNDMLLASVGLDKKIIFYDVLGKKVIKEMTAESPLTSISFMHDGAAFAVGSTRGKILVYDLRSGSTPLHSTLAHKSAVQCLSFQLPSKGNTSSSSSTLAEKFTNRSATDPSKSIPPPVPSGPRPGHGIATRPLSEAVQNGVTTNPEESTIFSPLREGLGATNNDLGKEPEHNEQYEVTTGGSKRTDSVTVSSIFSPVSNSTSSYKLSNSKSMDTFQSNNPTTQDLNGYPTLPSTKGDIQRIAKQPPTSTPYLGRPNLASAAGQSSATGTNEKNKHSSQLDTDKQLPITNNGRKSLLVPSSQMQVGKPQDLSNAQQGDDLSSHVLPNGPDRKSLASLADSREILNGFIQPSSMDPAENATGFQQFQMEFVKNLIDDALDEFRINIHRDIVNLQVEMLRQFQIQQNEMKALVQQYSLNGALVEENERLREEIKRLKATH